MYIGSNIKFFRTRMGFTQKQLAEAIGKTESSIRKYESNSVEAPLSVIEDISTFLSISSKDLMFADNLPFWDRIKFLSNKSGLSIKALSKKAGVPYMTLYSSMQRDSKISTEILMSLASALNVEPGELFKSEKEILPKEIYQINYQELSAIQLKTLVDNATNELLRRIGDQYYE